MAATETTTGVERCEYTFVRVGEYFAPGTAAFGAARYYELIFEHPRLECRANG